MTDYPRIENGNVERATKLIVDFHMGGANGHSLDLSDAPGAVQVLSGTGDVVLHEGPMPDRLHGVIFPSDRVLGFGIGRKAAKTVVYLLSLGPNGAEREYVIGVAEDADSANGWVERVNRLYQKRKDAIAARAKDGRAGAFRYKPVIHDVLETKVSIVLPGSYVYSERALDSMPSGLVPWENFFARRQIAHLQNIAGIHEPIAIKSLERTGHNYEWMAGRVKYTADNFKFRITQSLELVFDRQQRHESLGIVPLGIVEYFVMLYVEKGRVGRALGLPSASGKAKSFEEWARRIGSAEVRGERAQVGIPAHQSVEYSMWDAAANGMIATEQCRPVSSAAGLADWLLRNQDRGVVACDSGVAMEVVRAARSESRAITLGRYEVPYEQPVRVGLCYRQDDPDWAEIVRASVKDLRTTDDAEVRQSWQEFRDCAARVGIRTLAA